MTAVTKDLKDYTLQEWKDILNDECFRGHKIHRLAKIIASEDLPLIYNSEKGSLSCDKCKISLKRIVKRKSSCSFSRSVYLIKKNIFRINQKSHQARIRCLARQIFKTFNPDLPVDRAQEKKQWSDYKKLWREKKDAGDLTEMIAPEQANEFKKMEISDAHKELLVQALKVKELHPEYYTFIHGQKLGLWIINQFIKEMAKLSNPTQDVSLYHFFRCDTGQDKVTVQDIIDRIPLLGSYADHNSFIRRHLLSVDGYFYHGAIGESANHFVGGNNNVFFGAEHSILSEVCTHYLGVDRLEAESNALIDELVRLCGEYQQLSTIGNIYAICIPRENIEKFAYVSHPYGIPCKCKDSEKLKKTLNAQQNDIFERSPTACQGLFPQFDLVPQHRIAVDELNPKDNRVFLLTPVAKDIKDGFKEKIREIAAYVHNLRAY